MIRKTDTKGPREADTTKRSRGHDWPMDVRLELARAVVKQGLSASEVAKRLGVPYTTAIDWVRHYRARGTAAFETTQRAAVKKPTSGAAARRAAVLATHAAQPQAGSRRIRDVMKRFLGIGASETTVRRVLGAEHGRSMRTPAKAKRRPKVHRFERAEPNQLWQSDLFTFLLRKHERIYVAAFLDDHSRYLVSLSMAHHQRSTLVLEALARGIADCGTPREILTDQGRQYTAWRGSTEFEAELKRHGITHVKSRPHHPQTCGKIERFWKTMWEEFLARTVFADFEDCQRRVAHFVQHYNFQRPHQGLEGLTPADRFFRAASPVRAAIEKTVAENALRLAREQPPRKPFYLAGRLGDRDLSISASGALLKVRVGDDETMIPFTKESEHEEDLTRATRWQSGREAAEAPAPQRTEVAHGLDRARSDGEKPLPDAPLGALGRDAGDRCDRAGEDLARHLLPARDPGIERDPRGDEPACRKRDERALGGERADRAARSDAEAQHPGEPTHAAALAPHSQVDPRAAHDGPPGPAAEGARAELESGWQRRLSSFSEHDEGSGGRVPDPDAPWRALALKWERKLCAERAPTARAQEENADEQAQAKLPADPDGATGGDAAPCGDHRSARGPEDGVASRSIARPLAQPLPDDPAPRSARARECDHGEDGRTPGEATGDHDAAEGTEDAQAGERALEASDGLDRAAPASRERTLARAHPSDGSAAPLTQGDGSER